MWAYVIGLGALGAAIGYLIPLSQSPVLGTLLPLIFGLAGGAASIYSMRSDVTSPVARRKLTLLGSSLAAFCIALIATIAVSIRVRDADRPQHAAIDFASIEPHEALELAALRERLRLLRLDSIEQSTVLANAVNLIRQRDEQMAQAVEVKDKSAKTFRQETLAKVATLINELAPNFRLPAGVEAEEQEVEAIQTLEVLVNALGPALQDYVNRVAKGEELPEDGVSRGLEVLAGVLDTTIGSGSSAPYDSLLILSTNPENLLRLYALRSAISDFSSLSNLDQQANLSLETFMLQITGQDEFIRLLLGQEQQMAGPPVFEGFIAQNQYPPRDFRLGVGAS
ncbi:MAG: hypothetical protein ACREJ5_24580 [Geminicoccaceae bacterium]